MYGQEPQYGYQRFAAAVDGRLSAVKARSVDREAEDGGKVHNSYESRELACTTRDNNRVCFCQPAHESSSDGSQQAVGGHSTRAIR
jgi:hypothetical protein